MQIEKRWLLKDGANWIAIDHASGGYPYKADFWSAHKFSSYEETIKYMSVSFEDKESWEIYECDEVGTRHVPKATLYEIELEALKKKHNIA